MKIYTAYSPSHEVFKPWFDTIYNVHPDINVSYLKLDQKCETGEYDTTGWGKTTGEKLEKIIEIFDQEDGEDYFIFSDIDIQFFNPILKFTDTVLKRYDVVFQNDYNGNQCTGFFYCRKNKNTKRIFERALEINKQMHVDGIRNVDDQVAVQHVLNTESADIRHALLPKEFFTYGMFRTGHWSRDKEFKLPKNIIMHHSNWVSGIDNKLNLLQVVRDYYNNNIFSND